MSKLRDKLLSCQTVTLHAYDYVNQSTDCILRDLCRGPFVKAMSKYGTRMHVPIPLHHCTDWWSKAKPTEKKTLAAKFRHYLKLIVKKRSMYLIVFLICHFLFPICVIAFRDWTELGHEHAKARKSLGPQKKD